MKYLVFSFFANHATPLQKQEIDKWLKKEENKPIYWQWLEEWEKQNPEYQPDLEKHLARFATFMKEHTNGSHKSEGKFLMRKKAKTNCWKFSVMAVIILLIMGMGGWAFTDYFLYRQYKTAYGETRTLVLEDGSMVTLGENSSVKVPRWNFKLHREVYLKGEANFSITHAGDGKQFVVKVTGTEFSVLARQRGSQVHLTKGEMAVDYL